MGSREGHAPPPYRGIRFLLVPSFLGGKVALLTLCCEWDVCENRQTIASKSCTHIDAGESTNVGVVSQLNRVMTPPASALIHTLPQASVVAADQNPSSLPLHCLSVS